MTYFDAVLVWNICGSKYLIYIINILKRAMTFEWWMSCSKERILKVVPKHNMNALRGVEI